MTDKTVSPAGDVEVLAERFGMTTKHISRLRAAMLAEKKETV